MAYDLSNDLVALDPIDYSQGIYKTVQSIVKNINDLAEKHNSLDKDAENALNDLQNQIDNLTGEDIEELKAKVEALKELLGEGDAEDQFLDVIDLVNKLIDGLNAIKKNDSFTYQFNSETGDVTIDLSAYGFTDKNQYNIMVSKNGDEMAPVTLMVTKIDEKTAKVTARDIRHFAELNVKYTDGSEKADDGTYPNAFPFTILVSYNKVLIDKKAPREPQKNEG